MSNQEDAIREVAFSLERIAEALRHQNDIQIEIFEFHKGELKKQQLEKMAPPNMDRQGDS